MGREKIGNGEAAVETQKSTWSQEQNPARCWRFWEYYWDLWPISGARGCSAAHRTANDRIAPRVVKLEVVFHFMCFTCSPSVIKLLSGGFLRWIRKLTEKWRKQIKAETLTISPLLALITSTALTETCSCCSEVFLHRPVLLGPPECIRSQRFLYSGKLSSCVIMHMEYFPTYTYAKLLTCL